MKIGKLICAAALCCLGLGGCSRQKESTTPANSAKPSEPPMKAAPATPIAEKRDELGGKNWDPAWDKIVEQALPPEMLSAKAASAVKAYCPRFGQLPEANKRAFWAYTFQALAGAEAGLDPQADVHHTQAAVAKQDTVSHRPIRQEGLMQVTYQDGERYGCDFDWDRDKGLPEKDPSRTILQPKNNLECGVKIMRNQIIEQGKPMLARTSYWSTLQPGTASYRVFAKQMADVPGACKAGGH